MSALALLFSERDIVGRPALAHAVDGNQGLIKDVQRPASGY